MNALSPTPAPLQPYGLVSLWDMLKLKAKSYLELGGTIARASDYFDHFAEEKKKDPESKIDARGIFGHLGDLLEVCVDLELEVSTDLISKYMDLDKIPQTSELYNVLIECVYSELGSKSFFYIPSDRMKYLEAKTILVKRTLKAFPIASQEIKAASKCYATDSNTACVYHCMRALESGLRALAEDVGVTWTVQQWHVIINEIEKAIKNIGNTLPAGEDKSQRMQFLSEAAKEFAWFKDGWRNYAAHARVTYDSAQALKALEHVCAFFEVISGHLKE